MSVTDHEPRVDVEQELEFAELMDYLLADRVMLLSETDRRKLQGAEVTINDVKDTASGSGITQRVKFRVIDGATFMWGRFPAAIAYGRVNGQKNLLLTGAVFSPSSLKKTGIDPREADFFPALISEMPGHFSQFENSLGFYITRHSPDSYYLTVGGEQPDSIVSRQIIGPGKPFQTARALNAAVRMNVPRV